VGTLVVSMSMSEPLLSCSLGPEDIEGLVAAYEQALIALGIEDRNDPMTELVAKKVFEIRLSATAMSMSLTGCVDGSTRS